MKQSQKNCLIIAHYDPAKDRMERYKSFLRFLSLCAEKRFYFAFNFSDTRNPVSSVRKTKDIKII